MKKVIAVFILLLTLSIFVFDASAKTRVYLRSVLTGGTTGALDTLDGDLPSPTKHSDPLNDGDKAIVITLQNDSNNPQITAHYVLDADSGLAETPESPGVVPTVISPDTNPGTKRWLLTISKPGFNIGTDTQMLISNGTSLNNRTLSGGATIDNAGVVQIGSLEDSSGGNIVGDLSIKIGSSITDQTLIIGDEDAMPGAGGISHDGALDVSAIDFPAASFETQVTGDVSGTWGGLRGGLRQSLWITGDPTKNLAGITSFADFDPTSAAGNATIWGARINAAHQGVGDVSELIAIHAEAEYYDGTEPTGASGTIALSSAVRGRLTNSGGLGQPDEDYVLTNHYTIYADSNQTAPPSGGASLGGTHWSAFFGEEFLEYSGTVTTISGLWLEDMDANSYNNATNYYGIVLDGEGAGANIVMGSTQSGTLSFIDAAEAGEGSFVFDQRVDITKIWITAPPGGTNKLSENRYVLNADINSSSYKFIPTGNKIEIQEAGLVIGDLVSEDNIHQFNSNSTATTYSNIIGVRNQLIRTGTNGTQTVTTYKGFTTQFAASGSGNIDGSNWYHYYAADFPAFGGTVTSAYGMFIEDQTYGSSNYGIVLADDADGIHLNGTATPTIKIHGDGTNGAITVNAGLDLAGIPTGTTANGALGGGESVIGALCMSDSNEIYVDTDGNCAD